MSSSLHIEGDPTPWMLAETQPAEPTWLRASEPVALAVTKPLPGTLILSPRCAGSIALLPRAVQSDGRVLRLKPSIASRAASIAARLAGGSRRAARVISRPGTRKSFGASFAPSNLSA